MTKPDLGRYGVFIRGAPTPQQAREIEALGYGAIWVAGSPPAELDWVEPLLRVTTTLQVATAIVNIWTADAKTVSESFHRIDEAHPGRFLLGLGAGHPELHQQYRKPLDVLTGYLDILDRNGVPANRRVLAALGPKVLQLAADRTAGAIPYLTTLEHTAHARAVLGPNAFLAPEHKVVLTTHADQARAAGRKAIETSVKKVNYRNNWRRLGFAEADLANGGGDRLVDAVVAYGSPLSIAGRLNEYLDAGADHVPVQMLSEPADLVPALAELAAAL